MTDRPTPLTADEEEDFRADHEGAGTCFAIHPYPCLHVRLFATLDEARSAHSLPVGDDSPSLERLAEEIFLASNFDPESRYADVKRREVRDFARAITTQYARLFEGGHR